MLPYVAGIYLTLIHVVVDDTISIAVKGSAAVLRSQLKTNRCTLSSFHKVGARLIERIGPLEICFLVQIALESSDNSWTSQSFN